MKLRILHWESGFTLIETMAAITVFTLLLVGITPLVASSLRGSALSSTYTVHKNLVQQAMERVRGLPYTDAAPQRDVLDLYFPNLSTGYSSATNKFTTTCTRTTSTPAASGALACPLKNSDGTSQIPAGTTITFATRFVTPVLNSNPETYSAVTPTGWDSNVVGASPPASLMELTITANWTYGGQPKTFAETTLLGDRKLTTDSFRATSSVDFTVKALTGYVDSDGRVSSLEAIAGRSASSIELRSFAGANVDVSSGQLTLSQSESGDSPGSILVELHGAEAALNAPPDVSPATIQSQSAQTVTHPSFNTSVAGLGPTAVDEANPSPGATVGSQLPKATTNFAFTSLVGTDVFWANTQLPSGLDPLRLDGTLHMLGVQRLVNTRLSGNTYAEATAVAPVASRKVESTAHTQFGKMVLLPTTFIGGGVVEISDFTADVDCKSTGQLPAAVTTGSWSATLSYYRDLNPNDGGIAAGAYVSVPLSGSTTSGAADPLASLGVSSNPLVLDSLLPADRVYLFNDPATGKRGYLESWASLPLISSSKTNKTSRVDTNYAINVVTARTDSGNPESQLAVTIGKLSCQAVDGRA